MNAVRIHHVQVAIPQQRESDARRCYGDVLALREIPKPPALAAHCGAWFAVGDLELHLGAESDFRPARKAHVAFEVGNLDAVAARCLAAGHEPRADDAIDGVRRCFIDDPFINCLELIAARRPDPA